MVGIESTANLLALDHSDLYKELIALPFYKTFESLFVEYSQGPKREDDFGKKLLFTLCDVRGDQKTGLSGEAATILRGLLSLKIGLDTVNNDGKSPFDVCKTRGRWEMYEMMNLSQMGDSLKGSVVAERERVEALRATAASFIDTNRCLEKGKGHEMMEIIVKSLEESFDKRLPISEDILFIGWRWIHLTNDGRPLKTSLWRCMAKNLKEVLAIPMNMLYWKWFESNILRSAVWCFSVLLEGWKGWKKEKRPW